MKIRTLLLAAAFGFGILGTGVYANEVAASESKDLNKLTDGEVRKIDLVQGKVSIKHGPIAHLDMPGMTMVFTAKDKALLENIKAGDKIRFMVIQDGGIMWVTEIYPAN